MLNQNFLSSCLVGGAIVLVASPSYAKNALQPTEAANIARATVVRIEPTVNSPGSGVIIGRYREGLTNVYVVLTAGHVVQYGDDEYKVVTPFPQQSSTKQRQKIAISNSDIQKLPNVDLAIVKFRSDRAYQTATLGDSNYTTEGAGVYIAGFPNPGLGITRRVFQFTSSLVSSRLDTDSVEGEEDAGALEGGYALSYTNVTRAGMSGGPVFDVAGRVVGIHGKGDGDKIAGTEVSSRAGQESSARTEVIKSGFNLGIPIRTFLELIRNTAQLGIKFDGSQPGIIAGGNVIALRGGKRVSTIPPTNISEQEDTTNDIVVGSPANAAPSTPVAPQNSVPRQPAATPQNTSPSSRPSRPSGGGFF